ncbi:MAG: ABC transporter ATP-binding protein, partial [Anaerolineales bacterium]
LLALLGPSGCGKTTTLRLVAGFLKPDAGEIWVGERCLSSPTTVVPPERRRMAMIFQSYALWPHMTVAQNVAYGLRFNGVPGPERERRVSEMLKVVQLDGYEGRYPGELSGGQQQRVAVARALAGRPSILLADEPTGNLDSTNGEAVMTLLGELHRDGATVCLVTHDPRYARQARRTVELFDGRVVDELEAGG